MLSSWLSALLAVAVVLLGAGGAGHALRTLLRLDGHWKHLSMTMALGLSSRMLLQTTAAYWIPGGAPWIKGLFLAAAVYAIAMSVLRIPRCWSVLRASFVRWRREYLLILLLALLGSIFLATLRFPEYSDAYRAHFLIVEDLSRDGGLDAPNLLYYYGFAIGSMALYSAAASVPALYEPQLMHYAFLLLTALIIVESGTRLGYARPAALLAALLAVSILEVVVIARNPAYDLVALFFQLAVVFLLLDRKSASFAPREIPLLALLLYAAISSKLYGVIGVGLIGLLALRGRNKRSALLSAAGIALVLLAPALLGVAARFHSPLFPYIHNIFGQSCPGPAVAYDQDILSFLRYPFDLTFRYRFWTGPVFLAVLPLLFLPRWRAGAPSREGDILLFSLLFIALWFWLPFTSLSLRYQLLPFFLLALPIARVILAGYDGMRSATGRNGFLIAIALCVLTVVHVFPAFWYGGKKAVDMTLAVRSDLRDGARDMLRASYPDLAALDRALPEGARIYADVGDFEFLRHTHDMNNFLDDAGASSGSADLVVLNVRGIGAQPWCMVLLATNGHGERLEDWRSTIRATRTRIATIAGLYEIYR